MPKRKLPADAFENYFALGADRSYQAVADRYEVSKTAVANLAVKENWRHLVHERDRQVRESATKKASETLEQMQARHLTMIKAIQRKALEALRTMPLTTAMDAVRALDTSIKQERLVRGEPTDRSAVSVEEIIRREHDRWLIRGETKGDGSDAEPQDTGASARDDPA